MRSIIFKICFGAILVSVILGMVAARQTTVQASGIQAEVIGTLSQTENDGIVLDDGSTIYGIVSGIDFTPFLDMTVSVVGVINEDTLFADGLTIGAIHLAAQDGLVAASITDTVQQGQEGFEVSTEGVTFSLVGSDDLDEAVGHEAVIEGVAIGTMVTVDTVTIEE
jgi:hypothetical protein